MAGKMRVIRSRRAKVLCLGVSYADVEQQMSAVGKQPPPSATTTTYSLLNGSVKSAVDCVRAGILTEMDGRDLARCRSTEADCKVDVYTVSQEKGAVYRSDRHLEANFNRHDFCKSLRKTFGEDCQFDQIILDYFWIPTGWDASHWSRSFFESTLTSFVEEKVLKEKTGVVYLPFCLHCFKQVYICFNSIRKHYNISFVRKGELDEVSLWKGTQQIDAKIMQGVLGKKLSQEEKYCTFARNDVMQSMEDPDVSKKALIELANTLEDFPDVRFIRLEQLSTHRPFRVHRGGVMPIRLGNFRGCKDPAKVKGGFDQASISSTTTNTIVPGRQARVAAVDVEHEIANPVPPTPRSHKRNKPSRVVTPEPRKNASPQSGRANKRQKITASSPNAERAPRSISHAVDRVSKKAVIPATPVSHHYPTRTRVLHSSIAALVTPQRPKQPSCAKTSCAPTPADHAPDADSSLPVVAGSKKAVASETPVSHKYFTRSRTPSASSVACITPQEMALKHAKARASHSPRTVAALPMERGEDEERVEPKNLFPTTKDRTGVDNNGISGLSSAARLDSQSMTIDFTNNTPQALNNVEKEVIVDV